MAAVPRQAVVFELLAGLFGWIWIGADLSALVFIILALFGTSSWWNVVYAVIVIVISKLLMLGFEENKYRAFSKNK